MAYKVLKLNEPNETATVMSYLKTVLIHTKSGLLLRVSNHQIYVIIDRQIALRVKRTRWRNFIMYSLEFSDDKKFGDS